MVVLVVVFCLFVCFSFMVCDRSISSLSWFLLSTLNYFYGHVLFLIIKPYWIARNYRTRNEREVLALVFTSTAAYRWVFHIKFRSLMNFYCIKASIKILIKSTVGRLGLALGMSKHNSTWLTPGLKYMQANLAVIGQQRAVQCIRYRTNLLFLFFYNSGEM